MRTDNNKRLSATWKTLNKNQTKKAIKVYRDKPNLLLCGFSITTVKKKLSQKLLLYLLKLY